jgi:iron complex outermembrane receptor protein
MLSRYALDYLRHQVNISFDFRIVSRLYSSTTVTWRYRTGSWQNATGDVISFKPFWLTDTRFSWMAKNYKIYVEASNIFNTRYFDFGGLVQPGIWVRGGTTLNLEYSKKKSGSV